MSAESQLDVLAFAPHRDDIELTCSGTILKWGDNNGDGIPEENTLTGKPIYVIASEGYTDTGASKTIRIEAAPVPELTVPAALYTKSITTVQGTSTLVNGLEQCGR